MGQFDFDSCVAGRIRSGVMTPASPSKPPPHRGAGHDYDEQHDDDNEKGFVLDEHWICCARALAAIGAPDLARVPDVMAGLAHLGYPTYFATIIGV